MTRDEKRHGSTPEPVVTEAEPITTAGEIIPQAAPAQTKGRKLLKDHLRKNPHSPHQLFTSDIEEVARHPIAKWGHRESDLILGGYYIGFLKGYQARQLEERKAKKGSTTK